MVAKQVYVVTGVTGRTGSAAAHALLDAGKHVRVIVRDAAKGAEWAKRGAEVAVADYADSAALCQAFAGAAGAYIVSPPQYGSEHLFMQASAMAQSIAEAATLAKLPKLVVLSSVGAEQPAGTGWIGMNHLLEETLGSIGLPVTLLRAPYFMENWEPLVNLALEHGVLPSFLAPLDKQFSMIATEDIGRIAAEALCEHWDGVRILDLEGPSRYSPNDIAACIALKRGRAIKAGLIPESDWVQSIAGQGFSVAATTGFIEMTQGLNSGHIAFNEASGIERRLGALEFGSLLDSLVAG